MCDVLLSAAQAALLVAALSVDTLVAGFSYGIDKIKIPFRSALVVNLICAAILTAALFVGVGLSTAIHPFAAAVVCGVLLFLIGFLKLIDSLIKGLIRRRKNIDRSIKFNFLSLNWILRIYADPPEADCDRSKFLTAGESVSLALALSLDSLAVGVGAGMTGASYIFIPAFSLALGMGALCLGCLIGRKLASKTAVSLSWIGGVILIAMGVLKLVL
ncbi:MAG: sporulation membrane protein YtaF [Clostridiales bacterium]|jgi:putative sporulation protein YtaF|nr:sporulation membrane protein YtaF [Clostridiales bacterium]